MFSRSNAAEIVHEMLVYLETADYSIREEMVRGFHDWKIKKNYLFIDFLLQLSCMIIIVNFQVLKVAILAEKYAQDYTWLVVVLVLFHYFVLLLSL